MRQKILQMHTYISLNELKIAWCTNAKAYYTLELLLIICRTSENVWLSEIRNYSIDIINAYQFSINAVCTKWFAINLLKLSLRINGIIYNNEQKKSEWKKNVGKSCANRMYRRWKNGKVCQSNSNSITF